MDDNTSCMFAALLVFLHLADGLCMTSQQHFCSEKTLSRLMASVSTRITSKTVQVCMQVEYLLACSRHQHCLIQASNARARSLPSMVELMTYCPFERDRLRHLP
jgi:hypothetical protein